MMVDKKRDPKEDDVDEGETTEEDELGEDEDETDTEDDQSLPPPSLNNVPFLVIPMPHLTAAMSDQSDQQETDPDYDPREEYETDGDDKKLAKPVTKKRKRAPTPPPAHQDMYTEEDMDYFHKLEPTQKEVINKLEKEIEKINNVDVPLRFRILHSDMDISLKSVAITKANQLACMRSRDDEYFKLETWVQNLCKLPIGKYKPLPINSDSSRDDIAGFLDKIKLHLDETVYGHEETKDHIIRLLAKWIANKDSKGLVIGLEGVPGSGKTSIAMEICTALGLPFGFQSLGGISTAELLKGFQYTYQGSTWGSIADILMKAGCMNPIIFFDELDKVSTTRAGEEIINTLIHLTDHSQNHKYTDRYFADIDLDLSKCLMIFSYNDGMMINPILKDRMVRIKVSGYNLKDKTKIAKEFMLPKILREYAFGDGDIKFADDVISHIINIIEEEQGVRNLKRALEEIVSRVNLHRLLKKPIELSKTKLIDIAVPLEITREIADVFLTSKAEYEKNVSLNMMYL